MAIQKLSKSSIGMSRSNKMVYVQPLANAWTASFKQDDSSTAASQPAALSFLLANSNILQGSPIYWIGEK